MERIIAAGLGTGAIIAILICIIILLGEPLSVTHSLSGTRPKKQGIRKKYLPAFYKQQESHEFL